MDQISLSICAIAPALGIGNAISGFYKDYQKCARELEKLAKQADTSEAIIIAAHRIIRRAHESIEDTDSVSGSSGAISKQYLLCI